MKRVCRVALVVLVGIVLAGPAGGEDWPQWRGPKRAGVASPCPPLVEAVGKEGPKLLWEAPVPAGGPKAQYFSSPVVAGGKAYLHVYPAAEGADPNKPSLDEMILCVSMADGKEVWKVRFVGQGGKSHNTPCIRDGKVYFAIKTPGDRGGVGTAICLDADSGKEVWRSDFLKGRGPDFTPSLAVAGDKVVVFASKLFGLDAKTGTKQWETEPLIEPKTKWWMNVASPAVWEKAGKAYAIVGGSKLTCVAADDGKVLWHLPGSKAPTSPVVVGDTLVVRFPEGDLNVYRLSEGGAEKIAAAKLEAFDDASWEASTPAFDGRYVHGTCKKQTFCYDTEKQAMVWSDKLIGDAIASPVAGDGKMICCDGKKLVAINTADGKVLWQAKWTKAGCSSLALVDGRLVVNAGTFLRCYDLKKQ